MFRRRRPLPMGGRPQRRPARPGIQRVQRAEELFRQGDYDQSAYLFAELAEGASRRGMMEPAGNMHLRAARSFLEGGDIEESMRHARLGLNTFREAGRMDRVGQALPRVLAALERHGYGEEAVRLRQEMGNVPPPAGRMPGAGRRPRRGALPAKCPSCGAAMNSDEVEWSDPFTASCAYCGTPVKTEQPGS